MVYAFDPELATAVPALPITDLGDLVTARAAVSELRDRLPAPDLAGLRIDDVPVPADGHEVALRVYRPAHPVAPSALYFVHGGGFMVGDLDVAQVPCVELVRALGIVVVSVEYRLAPETPYPGPLEDVYTGLCWLADHADELGVDPDRIVTYGISSGGCLSGGLALLARDRGGPRVAYQFLNAPVLDDRLATPSMREFVDTPLWNRPQAEISWDAYLGPGLRATDAVPCYAAPARATDLTGLPPAYVAVKQFDPLRDEGIAYAVAMQAAGVNVELHLFPGTFHGSTRLTDAAISRREQEEQLAVLRHVTAR
ncbi:alpha/beta hydrolase [Amycolatopsis sp. NPDC004169]|uniref:alpha/beta hydrolase n=1 Tax=Amycolatopsis sp. NPDC004169 TaxID=3154453 RepID=UPI0033AD3A2F